MITKFNEMIIENKKEYWNEKIESYEMERIENFTGNGEFFNMFPQNRYGDTIYIKQSEYLIDEYKYLKADEASTINKLRTEHINLQNYKNYFFEKLDYNNNICKNCSRACFETVKHYLCDCPKYINERNRMYRELRKINQIYKKPIYRNTSSIIFPHTWQNELDSMDIDYKQKKITNTKARVDILKIVKKYVDETKRFNGDYGE